MTTDASPAAPAARPAFVYWGRRGAMARFAFELAAETARRRDCDALFIVSRANELLPELERTGARLSVVDTFGRPAGALLRLYRLPALIRRVRHALAAHESTAVVVLISHVWSPLVARFLKRPRRPYVVIVHDAERHPGDQYGLVNGLLLRDAAAADRVVTLSATTAAALAARGRIPQGRIRTLSLPVLHETGNGPRHWDGTRPLRLIFFGRIMAYKGLTLFAETLALLRAQGRQFTAGVYGAGNPGDAADRLAELGVTFVNRWIDDREMEPIFSAYDLCIVCHTEASQSGVIAAARGFGLPVVATPVGGLVEQVVHGKTGLLAEAATAPAIAAVIARFIDDPDLYNAVSYALVAGRAEGSMARFLDALLAVANEV